MLPTDLVAWTWRDGKPDVMVESKVYPTLYVGFVGELYHWMYREARYEARLIETRGHYYVRTQECDDQGRALWKRTTIDEIRKAVADGTDGKAQASEDR